MACALWKLSWPETAPLAPSYRAVTNSVGKLCKHGLALGLSFLTPGNYRCAMQRPIAAHGIATVKPPAVLQFLSQEAEAP